MPLDFFPPDAVFLAAAAEVVAAATSIAAGAVARAAESISRRASAISTPWSSTVAAAALPLLASARSSWFWLT